MRQIHEELTRETQALVDLEAPVDIRVVDQALPAYCRPGLLEVRPHHNDELILVLFLGLEEQVAVLERSFGVVDGARTDNDEQAFLLIGVFDDSDGLVAAFGDGSFGFGGLGDLGLEQVRRGERVVALDAPVFGLVLLANLLVLDEELSPILALSLRSLLESPPWSATQWRGRGRAQLTDMTGGLGANGYHRRKGQANEKKEKRRGCLDCRIMTGVQVDERTGTASLSTLFLQTHGGKKKSGARRRCHESTQRRHRNSDGLGCQDSIRARSAR